ncbi:hypothetical protein BDW72DRAFT_168488 [Aspergillus terricola var. indicus]
MLSSFKNKTAQIRLLQLYGPRCSRTNNGLALRTAVWYVSFVVVGSLNHTLDGLDNSHTSFHSSK